MARRRGRNRTDWLLLAVLLAAAAAPAAAQPAAVPPRAPVLLFISGASAADLPVPVAEVRAAATAALERSLARAGFGVVPADSLLPYLMADRVRSAFGTSPAFLRDLAAGTGATHLLVAVLLVEQGHLQLLARLAEPQSGCVVWASVAEQVVPRARRQPDPADAAAWLAGLDLLCQAARPVAGPPAAAQARLLVLLPARAVACAQEVALAATHCLLAPATGDPRWRVVDPGVAAVLLRDEGVSPDRIDAVGRERLRQVLGESLLAVPEIMVYSETGHGARSADSGEAVAPAAAEEYELALRFVDPRTGVLDAAYVSHRDHGTQVGWFGLRTDRSLLAGLSGAARTLWQTVDSNLEDR